MKEYKAVKADGVAVVILHKRRILLLKRRKIPFIFNPGIWSFVMGSKNRGEQYKETAYREVNEETGLERKAIKQLRKPIKVWMFDANKKKKWQNHLFFFSSSTNKIKLNIENSRFRWASLNELKKGKDYTNIFIDKKRVIKEIESCIK